MIRAILDADTGIDDALAIAYLLGCPDVQLTAVVASYGNVSMHTAARNCTAVLSMLGHPEIPVLPGAEKPSWAQAFIPDAGCKAFHGSNGLADLDAARYGSSIHTQGPIISEEYEQAIAAGFQRTIEGAWPRDPISIGGYLPGSPYAIPAWDMPSSVQSCAERYAHEAEKCAPQNGVEKTNVAATTAAEAGITEGAQAIIHAVRRYGSDITVITTGPLTNIDAALRTAPDIAPHCRIVSMGGALTQPGNCYDGVSETNIIHDPEAATRVFSSGADITLIGLDVTHQCLLSPKEVSCWRTNSSHTCTSGDFLADLVDFSARANAQSSPIFSSGMPLHDPLAAAVAIQPNLVRTFDCALSAQTGQEPGGAIRGRTVGDPSKLLSPHAPRTKVALHVQARAFVNMFVQRIHAMLQA